MNTLKDKIIFWGATGQAKVLRECLKNSNLNLEAVFDNNETLLSPFDDIPIFYKNSGFYNWKEKTKDFDKYFFLVAIGGDKGYERFKIHSFLEKEGLHPYTAIHKTAFVADDVNIGIGSQILVNSTICVGVSIGISCIINTSASIDHECKIGNGVHIAPGATLAGCVEVEDYVMVGTRAIILPRLKIGHNSIIGAGAVVTKDIPANSVVVGNPGKIIKNLNRDDK